MNSIGIDVSEHQGNINWNTLKSSINFAILRTGYGRNTLDQTFEKNVKEARNAGVPIPAVYHFSYALTPEDARIEADFVVRELRKMAVPEDTVVYFDYEEDSIRYAKSKGVNPTPAIVFSIMETFVNNIKNAGYKAGVYANQEFYTKWFNKLNGVPNCAFWYADWRKTPNAELVKIADIHQKSDNGKFPGINGRVDVNESKWTPKETPKPAEPQKKLSNEQIADEVIAGKWGNGEERKNKLTAAGYNYNDIQKIVNSKVSKATAKKSVDQIAREVINGVWGNGDERKRKLIANGYNYDEIQSAVNAIMAASNKLVSPAKEFDKSLEGTYTVNADALNVRYIPGVLTENNVTKIVYRGNKLNCYGYFTNVEGTKWLFVQFGNTTGFVNSKFVKKV